LSLERGGCTARTQGQEHLAERILSHKDITRIIEPEDNPCNHALLRFLYESDCRVSEVCGLAWLDVQPRANGLAQVTVFGKGDKTRHVLISEWFVQETTASASRGQDHAPAFPSKTAEPLTSPPIPRN
jgi:integrase/recombinase XerD